MSAPRAALLAVGVMLLAPAALAGPYDRLLRIVETDDAYKVRMKALRVLGKKIARSKAPAPDPVFATLSRVATEDDSYLVRGMACVVLGQLGDARGRPGLERAKGDGEAFVRAQAEAALERLAPRPEPSGGRLLVVSTEARPDLDVPEALTRDLQAYLQDELTSRAPGYRVATEGDGPGYLLTGTVSRLEGTPSDGGKVRLLLEVKLTVATWPERNLRHVMSAKASASVRKSQENLRVWRKLLRAALARAVADALAEIGGGRR